MFQWTALVCVLVCIARAVYGNPFDGLCGGENELVPLPGSGCQKFVSCYGLKDARGDQWCGSGTLFSEKTLQCEHSSQVNCRDSIQSTTPMYMFRNYNTDCFNGAWPRNCTFFSMCFNENRFDFHCNVDLVLNPRTGVCDYPHSLFDNEKDYCGIPRTPAFADRNPFLKSK